STRAGPAPRPHLPLPICQRDLAHPDLHSFPTRRSSDLSGARLSTRGAQESWARICNPRWVCSARKRTLASLRAWSPRASGASRRSEEHTSELQSRENLVCRLLLEKKKQTVGTEVAVSAN